MKNDLSKIGMGILAVAVLVPLGIHFYFGSIHWSPICKAISLRPGQIKQTFIINHTGRYVAEIEFGTGNLPQETVQCLTGITQFSPEPKCNESPILDFDWHLFRENKEIGSGRYDPLKNGGSASATVDAPFTIFDGRRGEIYALVIDVKSEAPARLDVTNPTLNVSVSSDYLEFALVLEGLSRVFGIVVGAIGVVLMGVRLFKFNKPRVRKLVGSASK
jgi:hypothetical protein